MAQLAHAAVLLALVAVVGPLCHASDPTGWVKLPRTDLASLNPIARVGNCGDDKPTPCNVTWLLQQCDATAGCNSVNTNGFMKECPGGYCDCSAPGVDACGSPSASTDVWVRRPRGPAAGTAWAVAVANHSMLYANPEAPVCYSPEIGNGYVGTVVGWGAMYVGGLFNGCCGSTHKARLPSAVAVRVSNGELLESALDMRRAVFLRRWQVPTSSAASAGSGAASAVTVEQRLYAHRVHRHILVNEFEVVGVQEVVHPRTAAAAAGAFVMLNLTTLWDPANQSSSVPGAGCAGDFSVDIAFAQQARGKAARAERWLGHTLLTGDDGEVFNVSVVTDSMPPPGQAVAMPATVGATHRFITAVATSLDLMDATARGPRRAATHPAWASLGGDDGAAVLALATSAYTNATVAAAALMPSHEAAWAGLWTSGIDVIPANADPLSLDSAHATAVATHANSSQYFLLSSVRPEWPVGVSPGGLATPNYQGAVFMDMDWWCEPALRVLYTEGAEALLEFRYRSIEASQRLAMLFGYGAQAGAPTQAVMFAWTAAYLGRPFGCCSGHGSYEDCLEQHVTGDVATSAWWHYLATKNSTWLSQRGWPLLQGIAEFWMSRVTPAPPLPPPSFANADADAAVAGLADNTSSYSINGILPIDEWCVASGCGCETPGINDDAHTNAVAKLSLRYAAMAARELGVTSGRTAQYATVAERILTPWNATAGRHNQWGVDAAENCPGGVGGSHYTARHTVCPEDVMMLAYPMGEAMGVNATVMARDADRFIPITCEENAGMTTPVHTIVNLALGRAEAAQASFNRSMHAACYGPFNVRNEVDKHPSIVGGHFDNTHFVTGDGGFLQAVIMGYGGLRIAEDGGLWVQKPTALPSGVGALRIRAMQWRGGTYRMDITVAPVAPTSWSRSSSLSAQSSAASVAQDLGVTIGLGHADTVTWMQKVCVGGAGGGQTVIHLGANETFTDASAFPLWISECI